MAAANGSPTPPAPRTGTAPIGRLAAMMFLQFFVWGSWYATTGNFILEGSGWGDEAPGITGNAYSVAPLAAILAPLFLGIVADRFFASERVLAVLMLLGAAAMAAIPSVLGDASAEADRTLFLGLLLAHSLCFMPTLGLTNTVAFSHVTNAEKQFPFIRAFGTLGWIVAATLVSKWEDWFGVSGWFGGPGWPAFEDLERSPGQYYVTAAASAIFALYSLTLPHTPPPAKGQKATAADLLGLRAIGMMKDRSFAAFILASALLCVPLAGYYGFATGFMTDSGIANAGFKSTFGQWSEILFMLAMPLAFARLGVKWMLAAGMAGWVLRYALFSGAAEGGPFDGGASTALILTGVILHGLCYDFFFVTGQIYTEKRAPKELRGQAQGFLVLMTQGFGLLVGAQLFKLLVGHYTAPQVDAAGAVVRDAAGEIVTQSDWATIWLWPCLAAGAILIVFCLLFRDRLSEAQRATLAADPTGSATDDGRPAAAGPGTGGAPAGGLA